MSSELFDIIYECTNLESINVEQMKCFLQGILLLFFCSQSLYFHFPVLGIMRSKDIGGVKTKEVSELLSDFTKDDKIERKKDFCAPTEEDKIFQNFCKLNTIWYQS